MPTVTEITEKYISEHRSIKDCLIKGVINYSALSRLILKELGLDKHISHEAVLIASRRYREKLKGKSWDDNIADMFQRNNVEIKNNIIIYTLDKNLYPDSLIEIEKNIKKEDNLFFSIEGTRTITLIIQSQNKSLIETKFRNNIRIRKENLSLITITSPGIADMPGAVSYITGLFFENEVNIDEFMSCHDDTLIVIKSKYVDRIIKIFGFKSYE